MRLLVVVALGACWRSTSEPAVVAPIATSAPQPIAIAEHRPIPTAFVATREGAYWIEHEAAWTIQFASGPGTMRTLISSAERIGALAVAGEQVYYATPDAVERITPSGSVTIGKTGFPATELAADASGVYAASELGDYVKVATTSFALVYDPEYGHASQFAVGRDAIYFSNRLGDGEQRILRFPKDGGDVTLIATHVDGRWAVVGNAVWYSTAAGLWQARDGRSLKRGAPVEILGSDDARVLVDEGGALRELAADGRVTKLASVGQIDRLALTSNAVWFARIGEDDATTIFRLARQ